MDLLQLRYFITVARTLNISKAAQYHMIPQPAMSKMISRLEKELGKPLFDRTRNKLTLTKEGEVFLQSITSSIAEMDLAVEKIRNEDGILRGELTLLVRQFRSAMVDCIVAFWHKFPDVSFRVFLTPEDQEIQNYDFCISCTPPSEQYHEGKPLVTEKLPLIVSVDHTLADRVTVPFEELKSEKFVMLDKERTQIAYLCQQCGFEPNISMVCEDLYCLSKLISSGMVITLGSEMSLRGISNNLVAVPTIPEVTRTTYVFENSRKISNRLRQTFLDFLIEFFSQLQDDKFDMISGTNGLLVAADGAFILEKDKRTEKIATLEITGRDQQEQRLHLEHDPESLLWTMQRAETQLRIQPPEPVLQVVADFITAENPSWCGSPTDLALALGIDMKPNQLSTKLNVNAQRLLNDYNIHYTNSRSHAGRRISLQLISSEA